MSREEFIKQLEKNGRQKTREKLLQGKYNPSEKPIVEAWLQEQKKTEAKESNLAARRALRISIVAIIISIISLLIPNILKIHGK